MILVDTNVWSELIRIEPDQKVVNWEAANGHLLWISTIVLAEFRARAFLMADGKRKKQISLAIEAIASQYSDRILDFDEPCSAQYGAVLLSARETGFPIDAADAMIAATARAKGMTLATRNTNDFAGTGVQLINPWDA
jgi:toxin FitB